MVCFMKIVRFDSVILTGQGVQAIPEDLVVSDDSTTISDRFIAFVESKIKLGAAKVRDP